MGIYTYVLLHMQRSCLTNHIPNFTESERMARKLEEIHARYDRAVLETKSLAEDKERFEIEARKYRNQLDHARLSLDNTYESETRLRQELEFSKKDLAKFQVCIINTYSILKITFFKKITANMYVYITSG